MSGKANIDYIDALKGFGIYLVVLGHVLTWTFGYFDVKDVEIICAEHSYLMFWRHLIYYFHMPLLFWVSGYLFYNPNRPFSIKMLPDYIWRKTYTLLIPFVVGGLIFHLVTGGDVTKYWFLRSLFIFIIVSIPIELIVAGRKSCILPVLLYLSVFLLLLLLKNTPMHDILGGGYLHEYQFFVFGVMCRRYKKLFVVFNSNILYTISIILIFFITWVYQSQALPTLFGIGYLYPYAFILVFHYLFKYCALGRLSTALQYLGRHSLEIYILHFFFVISVPAVGLYLIEYAEGSSFHIISALTQLLAYSVIVSSVVCLLALVAMRVIRTSNFLSLVWLGRKNKIC